MNTRNSATGSVHYIHLADPSEEGKNSDEKSGFKTLSKEDNPLATKLRLMASQGIITSEEYVQLTGFVVDR